MLPAHAEAVRKKIRDTTPRGEQTQETCPNGMKIMNLDKKYFLMGAFSTKKSPKGDNRLQTKHVLTVRQVGKLVLSARENRQRR